MNEMTKIFFSALFFILISMSASFGQSFPKSQQLGQERDNWTKSQLMQPAALAALLKNPKAPKPLIYNIGVVQDIQGAKNMGAASEKENLQRFKSMLTKLPKKTPLVVYCGCCPFDKCPNIRPAIKALNDGGFTNARLLNIPTNVKVDWINKGYPLAK